MNRGTAEKELRRASTRPSERTGNRLEDEVVLGNFEQREVRLVHGPFCRSSEIIQSRADIGRDVIPGQSAGVFTGLIGPNDGPGFQPPIDDVLFGVDPGDMAQRRFQATCG